MDDDREDLLGYTWHYVRGYARRQEWKNRKFVKNVYLHAQVSGYPMTDHINGNRLDCRSCNLRPTTPLHNNRNRKKPTGVRPYRGKWRARIGDKFLGVFRTEKAAWEARFAAEESLWLTPGDVARKKAAVDALR